MLTQKEITDANSKVLALEKTKFELIKKMEVINISTSRKQTLFDQIQDCHKKIKELKIVYEI